MEYFLCKSLTPREIDTMKQRHRGSNYNISISLGVRLLPEVIHQSSRKIDHINLSRSQTFTQAIRKGHAVIWRFQSLQELDFYICERCQSHTPENISISLGVRLLQSCQDYGSEHDQHINLSRSQTFTHGAGMIQISDETYQSLQELDFYLKYGMILKKD